MQKFLIFCVVISFLTMPVNVSAQTASGSIGISGKVHVDPKLIKLTIEAIDPRKEGNVVNQEDVITYRLTYSNENSRPTDLNLEVSWPKAQFINSVRPSVDLVDYVNGSATSGYNGASPIVDPVNNRIVWNIHQLPAITLNQTIEFKLKTKDMYIDTKEDVRFPVSFYATGPEEATPGEISQSEEVLWYKFRITNTTVDQNTKPLTTPFPTQPNPTNTITNSSARITDVEVRTVTSTSITFNVKTDIATQIQTNYGNTIQTLSQKLISPLSQKEHLVTITDLEPQKKYYFQFIISGSKWNQNLERYIVTTASKDNFEEIKNPFFTVLSHKGTILQIDTQSQNKITENRIKMWRNGVIDITVSVPLALKNIRKIEAFIRERNVLGVSTDNHDELQTQNAELTMLEYPLYAGRLRLPDKISDYEIVLKSTDIFGNIIEKSVGTARTVEPFIVLDKISQKPISGAKILLSKLNPNTNLYEEISVHAPFPNPQYSDEKGIIPIRMIEGKYKALIELNGFESTTVYFDLDENGANFPVVYLLEKSIVPEPIRERPLTSAIIAFILIFVSLVAGYKKLHKKKPRNIKKIRLQS